MNATELATDWPGANKNCLPNGISVIGTGPKLLEEAVTVKVSDTYVILFNGSKTRLDDRDYIR